VPKTSIRKDMLSRRRHLAAETSMTWSLQAQERFLALPEFGDAGCIALYSPVLNEVFTENIFAEARRLGKQVAYPRVTEDALEFVAVEDHRDLEPGAFGILEPSSSGKAVPVRIDLLAVPGVAFDRSGHRLGYGKGFYDRALRALSPRALFVGLAFEMQLREALPAEGHDVRLDLLVTEEQVLDFRSKTRSTRPGAVDLTVTT
jgi:5-formyltetrahydrofolate cyclo-ligase